MKSWKRSCFGLALLAGLTPGLSAQVPGAAPPVPGGVAAPAGAPAAAPAAAGPRSIWSFLIPGAAEKAACKAKMEKCCQTPIGRMLGNGISAASGGLIPPCPPTTAADLLKPPDSAGGAAARIKQDEAEAKARRADVRYLGTVDCNRWPEAEAALIAALRADRNECVRFEAALALGNGCCCTKATIEALALTVSGSTADGNPRETCERVRNAAYVALHHCLACYEEIVTPGGKVEPEPKPEPAPKPTPVPTTKSILPLYYQRAERMTMAQMAQRGRQAIELMNQHAGGSSIQPGERSVIQLMKHAFNPNDTATAKVEDRAANARSKPSEQPMVTVRPVPAAQPSPTASEPVTRVKYTEPFAADIGVPTTPKLSPPKTSEFGSQR